MEVLGVGSGGWCSSQQEDGPVAWGASVAVLGERGREGQVVRGVGATYSC